MLKKPIASGQQAKEPITIGSPDDEPASVPLMPESVKAGLQADLSRLRQADELMAQAKPNFDDPLIQQELRKREIFQKIMANRNPVMKDFLVDGLNYKFKILTPEETGEAIKLLMSLPDEERTPLRERGLMMAKALVSIDGFLLEDMYDGPEISDPTLKKYMQIFEWPNPLFSSLLRQFETFTDETRQRYLPDFLTQPKTESKG